MAEYTREALARLDKTIALYEGRLREAQLSMGAGADDGNNTWHDNPAFEEAQSNVRTWTTELRLMRQQRHDAVIIEPNGNTDEVSVGSFITVLYEGDDEPTELHLIGDHVVGRTGGEVLEISTKSPIGAAILGRKAGENVSFVTPRGGTQNITIVNIS